MIDEEGVMPSLFNPSYSYEGQHDLCLDDDLAIPSD